MKTFTKHILLLALMLFGVAGAAWADRAPQKFTGPVDIDDLVVGDTLAPGFELVCNGDSRIEISQGNAKVDGNPNEWDLYFNCALINDFSYGPNGAIIVGPNTATPAYGDWQDGNAWVVTDAYFEEYYRVTLGGILIDLAPDPTVPALDELTGNWNFLMPGSNKVVKVTYKALPGLAWVSGNDTLNNTTTTDLYRGFDSAFFAGLQLQMNSAFAAHFGGDVTHLDIPTTWASQETLITPSDLPGFQPMTEAEAKAWTGVPATGTGWLLYAYNADNSQWTYLLYESGSIDNEPYTYTLQRGDVYDLHVGYGTEYYYTTAGSATLRYGSSDPSVVTIDANGHAQAVGAGTATLYAVFDGDDDYQDDSAFFTVTIAEPATLTLQPNDYNMGTVSALLGGSALLTTVTAADNSSFTSGSQTFDGVATVTLEGEYLTNGGSNKGWYCQGSHLTATVTVNPVDGYTIDSVKFYCQNGNSSAMDTEAPFMATVVTGQSSSDIQSYLNGIAIGNDGITKIEVYGAAASDSIVATATEGQYLVIPGATVQVVATAVDGAHVSAWSPINKAVTNLLSDTATFTVGETMTLTATFVENPLLTLASNNSEWGTVTLDGITPGVTTYNITISENPYPDVTYTNVSFPFHATVFIHEGLDEVEAGEQTPLIVDRVGDNADITINGPYGGTIEYSYNNHEGAGVKAIFCDAVEGLPIMPEGVTYAGSNTYLVLPGTTVNVTATPDSAHYLSAIDGHDTVSNYACGYSFVMPSSDKDLLAVFNDKPTLTLAQTDGGTLEAIGSGDATIWNSETWNGWTYSEKEHTVGDITLQTTGFASDYNGNLDIFVSVYDDNKTVTFSTTGDNFTRIELTMTSGATFGDYGQPNILPADGWTVTEGDNVAVWEGNAASITMSSCSTAVSQIAFYRGTGTANVIASSTPNTYYIDYGTPVTVVATPDAEHYLVSFSDDAPATERNSNLAVEKTYDSVINNINLTANFQAKPVLTLTANTGGTLTVEGAGSAGGEVTIGNGTETTSVTPYNSLWEYSFVESLYTAEEIGTAGTITSVSYHLRENDEPQTSDFVIYMKNVSRSTFASGTDYEPVTDADIVYSGSVTFNPGWTTITLGTPFEYDGTSNLMIAFDENIPGFITRYFYYTDNAGKVVSYHADNYNPDPYNLGSYAGNKTVSSNRANIKLDIAPAATAIVALSDTTYRVDYGTDVTVVATPDSIHYLATLGDVTMGSNTAKDTTFRMTATTNLEANFELKPTLTLAHNDGGEMEVIEPEPAATAIVPPTDQMVGWESSYGGSLTEDDIPAEFGFVAVNQAAAAAWAGVPASGDAMLIYGIEGDTLYYVSFHDGSLTGNSTIFFSFGTFYDMASAGTLYITTGVTPSNVTASTEPNTYYIDYNTSVTVKAMPSDTTYLVRFDEDADTNSNTAVEKTYQNITADVTSEALFAPKPTLTLAANDTTWGKVTIPIGLVATDPTPAPTPTAVANPVITGVLMPDGSMQVTMSCTTQDADIYYTTDNVTSPLCDCPAAPEYTDPITFTEPVTIKAAAYTGNDWSAVVTKTITLGLPAGVAQLTDSTYRVDYGASVTVQAIPDTAHYLVRFDNDADTNSNVAVEKTYQNITADVTSEALFAPKPKLTLAKTRTMDDTDDWGSVSFNPLQYPWLGTSQNTGPLFLTDEPDVYVVDYGATVTVTADATDLHHVANWVDADSAAYPADRITYSAYFVTEPVALFPDSSTLTLTVTADTTAKAVFGINSYDVFATAQLDDRDEIGTGTAMGYLNVSYKDIVGTTQTAGPEDTLDYTAQGGSLSTITSTSYYGYRFSGWYDADMDTLMSSVNPLTLTEAAVVEARYTPINYTITGLSEDDEMGTVTGGGTLPYRTPVSLTAVPERGYHFTGWDNGLSANPLELAAMSDFTVTASFAPNQYTVTVLSGDETMGSASGSTVADFHTTVTLTATPNAHYHFVAWSNGVTDTVTELLVDGDTTVTALFAADEYTITGLSADATMGSVSGSATVTYPATVTLTATAANCHHFVQWNDGVTANPRTVNALEDLTLTATFAASTYASSEDVTTCDNYTWNNVTYTASGTYTYNTTTLAGCDSTATLHLTLITGIETEEVVEACESYEWHGVVYTQSTGILGAPTYTTTALNGCDSTVTLRLTINHGTTAVETVEACDSYTWNGRTYFSSTTTATYTTEGSNGCDSTTTLHLTLGRSTSGELNVEACESYTWHGVTYTESIVGPTDTNLNTSGCPHVTTLHLTILRNSSSEETVEACDVYNWHGVNRYASGDYVFLSPNAVGCDSTAILHLTIRRSTHAEEIAAACDEYEWHGILFTESADTTLHTLNAAGCDSAMTLHLTLYYNSEATDVVTACDSYTWIDGVTYTASTDEPTYTIAGANCSTTVTLNLTVNYSTAGIDEQEAVDSYTWINGITYTASTDQPTFVLTNAAGCDSVVTLHLTITYTPEPVYYNVTLATADATMGSVAPAGTTVIEEGLSFTATATALTGRHFVAWVSNGTVVSNANPYTFVVNDDVELTATFDYDEVIAVLTVNDETMGTTTPAPGTYTFHVGDEATVTATANEHYHFVGWTVNGTPINTQETTYTVTVTPEMAGTTFYVEAVFAQNEGIDDNEGILETTIYAQEGQIVVEGAGNSTVVLYDVTGRRLAVKHSDNAPLRFDIAVSGTYLVKVGNAPAKRIVMVR